MGLLIALLILALHIAIPAVCICLIIRFIIKTWFKYKYRDNEDDI